MFGLKQEHIAKIQDCMAQFPKIERVIIYGSRAMGNYRLGSDIDFAIIGELDFSAMLKLENQLDDLLLPYKIDISLLRTVENPALIDHIQRAGKVFYEKKI